MPEELVYNQTPVKKLNDGVWQLDDHLLGFDSQGYNKLISSIDPAEIHTEYVLPDWVKKNYPQHTFKFNAELMIKNNHLMQAIEFDNPTSLLTFNNFLCCFNRSHHPGREWVAKELFRRNLFDPKFCSKGFVIPQQKFDASIHNFLKQITIHGISSQVDVKSNLFELSPLISSSFINLVSETVPESYVPFPTEKFLFPVLNKRLWISYAQPRYHEFLTDVLGFQLYDAFFDYSFDKIKDPQQRLISMLDEIEPYSKLSNSAWRSIYKALEPVIEHNYHWAKTGQFIDRLRSLNEV